MPSQTDTNMKNSQLSKIQDKFSGFPITFFPTSLSEVFQEGARSLRGVPSECELYMIAKSSSTTWMLELFYPVGNDAYYLTKPSLRADDPIIIIIIIIIARWHTAGHSEEAVQHVKHIITYSPRRTVNFQTGNQSIHTTTNDVHTCMNMNINMRITRKFLRRELLRCNLPSKYNRPTCHVY